MTHHRQLFAARKSSTALNAFAGYSVIGTFTRWPDVPVVKWNAAL